MKQEASTIVGNLKIFIYVVIKLILYARIKETKCIKCQYFVKQIKFYENI